MNKLEQRVIADDFLDKLYPYAPYAIIAGGAPRDWYFGKDASDIDVFFYRPDVINWGTTMKIFNSIGLVLEPIGENNSWKDFYAHNPLISNVYDCYYGGVKFQLVKTNSQTFNTVVQSFPLNMSMIWYKFGQIEPSKEFLVGERHKALIKLNAVYADGNRYIQKIKSKFPDYTYYPSLLDFHRDLE